MHIFWFESPDMRKIAFWLVNRVALLLRYIVLAQSYPIYIVLALDFNCTALHVVLEINANKCWLLRKQYYKNHERYTLQIDAKIAPLVIIFWCFILLLLVIEYCTTECFDRLHINMLDFEAQSALWSISAICPKITVLSLTLAARVLFRFRFVKVLF